MSNITWADKVEGATDATGKWTAADANEVKSAVNSKADSALINQSVAFNASIPFTSAMTVMSKAVTGPLTLTPNTTGAVAGFGTVLTIDANGTNIPVFSGFRKMANSLDYTNTAGWRHLVAFVYNGFGYYYSILDAYFVDAVAPTIVSASAINATTIRVVFNEAVTATNVGWSFKKNGVAHNPTGVSGSGTNTLDFTVGTMLSTDTILRSYDASTGDTADIGGNEIASFTDQAVTNSINSLQDINFATVTSGFAKTANYWSGAISGTYANYGLADKVFTGDGYIEFLFEANDGRDAILALRLNAANEPFTANNYRAAAWISSGDGKIYRIDNAGGAADTTISAAIGDYIRLSRTGSTIKLQKRTGATIVDIYTFSFSSAADLYIQGNTNNTQRLYKPQGNNLV